MTLRKPATLVSVFRALTSVAPFVALCYKTFTHLLSSYAVEK